MTTASVDLKTFSANVKNLARPNRFLVTFGNMTEANHGAALPANYQYYVRSASLPAKTIPDIANLYWFGLNYKFGGDPTFEAITLKFLANHSYDLRSVFEKWMDKIAHTKDNTRGDPALYKTSVVLSQLDDANTVSASYVCEGVYPTTVSTMDLNHDTNSAILEFDVTFNLDYFSNGTDAGVVASGTDIPTGVTL